MRGDRHVHGFYWTDALRVANVLEHRRNSWLRMKNEDEERWSWGEGGDCRKGSSEKLLPRISTLILVCVAKSFSFTFPLHDLSIFKQQSICHLQHISIFTSAFWLCPSENGYRRYRQDGDDLVKSALFFQIWKPFPPRNAWQVQVSRWASRGSPLTAKWWSIISFFLQILFSFAQFRLLFSLFLGITSDISPTLCSRAF